MPALIYTLERRFADDICEFVSDALVDDSVELAFSSQAFIEELGLDSFDLLILDLATIQEGPQDIIAEIERAENDISVIILYEELTADLQLLLDHDSVVDIRSKTAVEQNPELLLPLLRHLSKPQTTIATKFLDPDLKTVFSEHALPMLLIDPDDGAILDANDAAIDFYGYPHRELTEMAIQEINALDPAEIAERRQQAKQRDQQYFVFPHRLRNGELRTVEVNSTPITHGGKTVLFSIIQDITQRVTAEENLRVARDHYKRLTEQNIVGIYTIKDERFTYVNPKMGDIFGMPQEELVGRQIYDVVAAGDRELVRKNIRDRVEGRTKTSHYTFAGVHPDNDRLVIEVHGSRIQTEDGVAIIGTMLDITERENFAAELRRISLALDATAHAVYITDTNTTIEYVNPAFEEITGYSESEALGRTPSILRSGKMDDEYYQRLYETLESGDVWEETVTNRRKGGELYYAYQTIAPYQNEDGEVEGYVAIQSDISETQIQQQVLEVFQRIFRHNLRNELNVIRGYTEVLGEELTETPLATYVDDIAEAAESLHAISQKAQVVDRATHEIDPSVTTELSSVIKREVSYIETQYPGITIATAVPESLLVRGDGRIDIALQEILQNAIEHCDRTPEISIQVSENTDESQAIVVIEDNGPGIDDMEMTTMEFGEETPLRHGSGLGLWVIKWTITSLGGDVLFENNEPRGLRVTVRLPLASN